jgi:hypothetical protein
VYPAAGSSLAGRVTSGIGLAGHAGDAGQPCLSGTGAIDSASAEALLPQVIGALDDGIILAAHGGTIALANRHVEEMFGHLNGLLPLSRSRQ